MSGWDKCLLEIGIYSTDTGVASIAHCVFSVKGRMESAAGINYAEFTYQLLQSYDFWHLYRTKDCSLQIGGNDQYGNITAGIDLITRLHKAHNPSSSETSGDERLPKVFGLTVPLLTTPTGEKIGKTAGNAVWLDPTLTSPFDLYQYFVRLPDTVVYSYLTRFTLVPLPILQEVMAEHEVAKENRTAQHLLAKEVVELIHGPQAASQAQLQTKLLFPGPDTAGVAFTAKEVIDAFGDKVVKAGRDDIIGQSLAKVLKSIKIAHSSSEAKKTIHAGAVYVGPRSEKATDPGEPVKEDWLLEGSVLLLRVGKGKFTVVQLV